jgi:Cof subfamily protein (haloacid dehalogenase superfamily)
VTNVPPIGIPHIDDGLPIDWTPQLIALDIDDTLTVHLGEMKPRVIEAISAVRERGIDVVLATGRAFDTTSPVAREAGLDGYVVCSNGAILGDVAKDKIIEAVTFDAAPVIEKLDELVPGAVFAVEDMHGVFYTTKMFSTGPLGLKIHEVSLEDLTKEPVVRLVMRSNRHTQDVFGHAAAQLGYHQVVYGVADVAWMDVGPHDVSKASMLHEVCARKDIPAERVVAIGDNWNDVQMLNWAGLGVAMGHAVPEIQAQANLITHAEPGDGVAAVLEAIAAT